jgi:hypothetical protein
MLPGSLAVSSALSSVNTLNTRRLERFRVSGDVSLSLNPQGGDNSAIRGGLIDINRVGGMGIFVTSQNDLDAMPLASVLGRWRIRRDTAAGPIAFSVRLLQAVPRTRGGRGGLRISALPASQKTSPEGPRFFAVSRRRVERNPANSRSVLLMHGARKLRGRLLNISENDGFGVQLESSALVKVRIGELFCDGWQVAAAGTTLSCALKRIGCRLGKVVVGAVAPGIARLLDAQPEKPSSRRAAETNRPSSATTATDDDFTRALNDVLDWKLRGMN